MRSSPESRVTGKKMCHASLTNRYELGLDQSSLTHQKIILVRGVGDPCHLSANDLNLSDAYLRSALSPSLAALAARPAGVRLRDARAPRSLTPRRFHTRSGSPRSLSPPRGRLDSTQVPTASMKFSMFQRFQHCKVSPKLPVLLCTDS